MSNDTFPISASASTPESPLLRVLGGIARRVVIQGSTLSAIEIGSGPAIVLGPSFLWDARMWVPQIAALRDRYRIIVPDLWGHGRSGPMPAETTDMRALARQHLALLNRLEIERFAVVGLSVGGIWGAELALMAPERVTALVLMDTSLAAEPEETRARYFALLDACEASGGLPDAAREAVVPLFFSPDVGTRRPDLPAEFDAMLRAWDPARLVDSVVPLGRLIFGRRDALDDLAQLTMPALVMTGSDDIVRPPAEGRRMAERLRCGFLEVPGAGHIATLEAPDFVAGALDTFMAETLAPLEPR
jgi:pimeloyl-ACP methyl ester carboxylesterase